MSRSADDYSYFTDSPRSFLLFSVTQKEKVLYLRAVVLCFLCEAAEAQIFFFIYFLSDQNATAVSSYDIKQIHFFCPVPTSFYYLSECWDSPWINLQITLEPWCLGAYNTAVVVPIAHTLPLGHTNILNLIYLQMIVTKIVQYQIRSFSNVKFTALDFFFLLVCISAFFFLSCTSNIYS